MAGRGQHRPGARTAVDLIPRGEDPVWDNVRIVEIVLGGRVHPFVELGLGDAFAQTAPAPFGERHVRIAQEVVGCLRTRATRELTSGSRDDLGRQAGVVGMQMGAHEQRQLIR